MKQHPKIAIVINTLNGGGAEKACITLARSLRDAGAQAYLIIFIKKCDYQIPNDVNVQFLSEDSQLNIHKNKNKKILSERLVALDKKIDTFDLCISNLDECHPIVALANIKNTYFVIHNSTESKIKKSVGIKQYFRTKKTYKILNNRNIITVSKGIAEEIKERKRFSPSSITVIYNPININEIITLSCEEDPDIPKKPYLIHIGRCARQKRHDVLLKAYKLLDKAIILVLLSNKSTKLHRLIKKFQLNKTQVQIPDFKQNPYPWIKHAKALILSSDYEGFGMVIAEALICGTPVVATNCPHGPSEIMTGDLANFLVPVSSPEAIKDKLQKILNAPPNIGKLPITERISHDIVAKQYIDLINDEIL